jgi:hypothetical protein
MTDSEPEIETVTVTFEEFKENREHYVELRATKRLVVLYEGEQIAAFGPWLPGEQRPFPPPWFWDEIYPPQPIDPDDPYVVSKALEAVRGYRPFS